MPPELSQYHPLITYTTQSLARLSPKSQLRHRRYMQVCLRKMKISKTKLVPLLVFCFSIASIFCFLKITEVTYSPQQPLTVLNVSDHHNYMNLSRDNAAPNLTEKETKFLLEFFSKRKPCNLLVFGHEDLYSTLNSGGLTLLLDENPHSSSAAQTSNGSVQVHQIRFDTCEIVYIAVLDLLEGFTCHLIITFAWRLYAHMQVLHTSSIQAIKLDPRHYSLIHTIH